MNRKPWPILVGIILVLALAAAALLGRPRPIHCAFSLPFTHSPCLPLTLFSRLPSTVYRLRHLGGGERCAGGDCPLG
ncbi:MAG: hypothetical protein WHX52_22045 [Anaerolineae bacterium]